MTTTSPSALPTASPSLPLRLAALARIDFSNTPARIASARNICIGLCFAFFSFFIAYHSYLTHAFQTIGINSAPSIVLAEQIRHQLALADSLFSLASSAQGAERQAHARKGLEALDRARDQIVAAGANVTYGEEELAPLRKLGRALGAYDQAIAAAAARNFDFELVRPASIIMREAALPAATALDEANSDHLEKAFSSHGANALVSGLPAMFLCAALLIALLWAQLDLYRRTNRTLNAGYLAATAGALAFSIVCAFSMIAAEGSLKIAKRDAFDSVHALWLAKSVAEQARSERALMLLTSGRPSDFAVPEAAWTLLSGKISPLDAKGLRLAVSDSRKFGGFLGTAFANITFDGERAELVAASKAWATFIDLLPPSLAAAARSSKLAPGSPAANDLLGSSLAFDDFSLHIDRAIQINQSVFDQEVNKAMSRLRILPWLAALLLALVCAGAFFGSKPRLDEYRF